MSITIAKSSKAPKVARASAHPGGPGPVAGPSLRWFGQAAPPLRLAAQRCADPSPASERAGCLLQTQSALLISSPADAAEKEAAATGRRIARMSLHEAPAEPASALSLRPLQQLSRRASFETIHRMEQGSGVVPSGLATNIQGQMAGGAPLPIGARAFMEPRFGADFSGVRVHTGNSAARLSRQLNAHAFTTGKHIFFGEGKFKPGSDEGRELLAHELTHTIQQGAVVQRSEAPTVSERTAPTVHRLFDSLNPLNWIADKANLIPGFRMFTIILGVNPINMSAVSRSAANILRALIEFLPGGGLITQALENSGVFEKAGAFVEQQIATLGLVGGSIRKALSAFIDSLSFSDLAHLGGVWERAKRIFTDPITRIIDFAKGLVSGIIQLIKDAILRPVAKLAEGTEGYNLLKGILGKDPVTGDPVQRSAETLLGPFMKMIGQGEIWENMRKANAIGRCWVWFQSTMSQLIAIVSGIPGAFIAAFKSLTIEDIILVPKAFIKLGKVFLGFLGKFVNWGLTAIWNLLEIIFDVVSPGALTYIKKTGSALKSIFKNPLPFVGNLVKAAKLGFSNFASNFLTHLKNGLIDWLTGAMEGVYLPKAMSLVEIGKFALSVLGITWAQIRAKIVKALGPAGEKIMAALETAFDIVVALVKGGPAAAWEVIKEKLSDLKDTVIGGIINMVIETVVSKAVPKLISMFIPGAGFISAIISIYDTIMVFVNKISKIIQVVKGFVDSIVGIAAGAIGPAAAKVESTLAGALSLAISFLAGFVGLGKIADKVLGVIKRVQAAVDKALDAAINWIIGKAKALFGKLFGGKEENADPEKAKKVATGLAAIDQEDAKALQAGKQSREDAERIAATVKSQHPVFKAIRVIDDGDAWDYEYEASRPKTQKGLKKEKGSEEKKLEIEHTPGQLGGDEVGMRMTIRWLGRNPPTGTPPESGVQSKLMGLLVTDPSERSPNKYVRGHLLNEHLGGRGIAKNLFPITGNANSQHLHSTEKKIKDWVLKPKKGGKTNLWVFYTVKVNKLDVHLDPRKKQSPANWVDAEFVCNAHQADANGNQAGDAPLSTVIRSVFGEKWKAGTDNEDPTRVR